MYTAFVRSAIRRSPTLNGSLARFAGGRREFVSPVLDSTIVKFLQVLPPLTFHVVVVAPVQAISSGDTLCRVGRPCRRSEVRRSDSLLRKSRPWVPKCPTGIDGEWQLLGKAVVFSPRLAANCCPAARASLTRALCLQRGSPAPPCSLLPVLGRLIRPPGTAVSHTMRCGPPSRRAFLSRRMESGGVHAHAPAKGRRVQRYAALLGSRLCQPSSRPQLRDNPRPLELCVPQSNREANGKGSEAPAVTRLQPRLRRPSQQASCSSSRASWQRRSTARKRSRQTARAYKRGWAELGSTARAPSRTSTIALGCTRWPTPPAGALCRFMSMRPAGSSRRSSTRPEVDANGAEIARGRARRIW